MRYSAKRLAWRLVWLSAADGDARLYAQALRLAHETTTLRWGACERTFFQRGFRAVWGDRADGGFGPDVYAAELSGEKDKAELRMLLEYLPNDGTYDDVAKLSETLKRATQCGVIHTELLQEHIRFARGRGC